MDKLFCFHWLHWLQLNFSRLIADKCNTLCDEEEFALLYKCVVSLVSKGLLNTQTVNDVLLICINGHVGLRTYNPTHRQSDAPIVRGTDSAIALLLF